MTKMLIFFIDGKSTFFLCAFARIFVKIMQAFNILLKEATMQAVQSLYGISIAQNDLTVNETKAEFDGHYTLVTFNLSKLLRKSPAQLAQELGDYLLVNNTIFKNFNVVQGFLNINFNETIIYNFLQNNLSKNNLNADANGKSVMVEFSSPNTNKPLHFGHLRNNFLGDSVSRILNANGNKVIKVNLVNDRGIHICKSMYTWMLEANGATPQSTGIKGDHFVGDYYVRFETILKAELEIIKKEIAANNFTNIAPNHLEILQKLIATKAATADEEKQKEIESKINETLKLNTPCMLGAQKLLLQWEENDEHVRKVWHTMNSWVYEGFKTTYETSGISFDKYYYESETYLRGKDLVQEGLQKGILFKKEDNSIWIDLTADGLDEKLLLRGNGTSVYMTQDLGTAQIKYNDYKMDASMYVIADEQNYHMQVLKLILQKLKEPGADGIQHISYGMVELPDGKMKSREGTVVDADDMLHEIQDIAKKHTIELGKTEGFTEQELETLYHTIGMGALKFYLLRVEAKKKMIFNPKESIDFHGFTGPFIQYTHARICSILRKQNANISINNFTEKLLPLEEKLILNLEQYQSVIAQAATDTNPGHICNYVFALAKQFNGLLAEHKIISAETEEKKELRLQLCLLTKNTIAHALGLLGISAPEKM
jgi:arginyl-tRNA synthetase